MSAPTAADAIVEYGTLPADEFPVDEPNMLIKSFSAAAKREKKLYKGPQKVYQIARYQNPTMEFDCDAIITALDAALTNQHPGSVVDALANFPDEVTIMGFTNTDGVMIYEDPTRKGNNEDPADITFKVLQLPFVPAPES